MNPAEDDTDALRRRVADALFDLSGIGSDDPAAMGARHALRLTRHTLESFWLPTLELVSSREQYDDV